MTAQARRDQLDVVIIGAGPAGLAAGAQAARRGLSHVVLERGALANTVVKYQKGKHVMDEPARLPLRSEVLLPFSAGSREEVLESWTQATRTAGTSLRIGRDCEVTGISGAKGDLTVALRGGEHLRCRDVVIAIGLQGNLRRFQVPGGDLPHVTHQLDDPDEHIDKRILVVGVGDAGIENALALSRHNEVSLVNRGDEFDRAKPGNQALIEAAIQAREVVHYTHATVKRIGPGCVLLDTNQGEIRVDADLVIGRLGATPPREFLESVGIQFPSADRSALPRLSPTYESNVRGIYLVGSVAGYPLIKSALNQGYEVVEYILGNNVEPADEPLLREKFAGLPGTVGENLARIQATLPLFRSLTTIQLREFLVDSAVHRPEAGARLFGRNEFTNSFYSILRGTVEVVAPSSDAAADTVYATEQEQQERRFSLGAGQFFGEMGLVSGRRRAATVIAGPDCVLIETPRTSMNKLLKSAPEVKRVIDEAFILRKLQIAFTPGIPVADLQELARAAVIETYRQGETLFEQEAPSNGVHFIRLGSVTVSHRSGDRDVVLAYLPAGNIVGEMALFSPEHRRSASVRATVLTETIRLPTEAIAPFLERHPSLRSQLRALQSQRLVENIARSAAASTGDLVSFLMSAGAGEATDMLLIDESICIRCDNCERACAQTHGGVSRLDREAGPTLATVHIPTSCRHCENPKCMTDCPPDALRRHPNGEVFIMDNCIGCGNCAVNCPYDVIQMASVDPPRRPNLMLQILFGLGSRPSRKRAHDDAKKAVKCDLCRELPGAGEGATACVAACPTGAVVRVNPKTYVDVLYVDPERG
jgi:CRP-like cAMP-binding protein/thioredoxin reductase/Fe-S-cluster-containing dehydrogenase component